MQSPQYVAVSLISAKDVASSEKRILDVIRANEGSEFVSHYNALLL